MKTVKIGQREYPAKSANELQTGDRDQNGDTITVLDTQGKMVKYQKNGQIYRCRGTTLIALWSGLHPADGHRRPNEVERFFKHLDKSGNPCK